MGSVTIAESGHWAGTAWIRGCFSEEWHPCYSGWPRPHSSDSDATIQRGGFSVVRCGGGFVDDFCIDSVAKVMTSRQE